MRRALIAFTAILFSLMALLFLSLASIHFVHAQQAFQPANKIVFTTTSISPGLLLVGPSVATNFTVTSAKAGMPCSVTASDGTDIISLGAIPLCTVVSDDTVAVRFMAIISVTPPAKVYTITVHST